ncbi:unnamed protein product [Parnassius apollo]|uniref:(apollo) hypothetical protein n=1 Tax=Parnassius apollo TaxID=110799 RepID=A0A8S3XA99_PARAO|nr:unnamed protein product [Parnassius apollo]
MSTMTRANMCPIWPLHIIILYLLALYPMWAVCQAVPNLLATFDPSDITVHMDAYKFVNVTVTGDGLLGADEIIVTVPNDHVANADWNSTNKLTEEEASSTRWQGRLQVSGKFLGRTDLVLELHRGASVHPVNGTIPVTVIRPERIIDTIFTSSVAAFVSLIFINFGCAMHWPTVKEVLKRPIGPLIGMCGQFLFMPLMSFGLGFLVFPSLPEMRLGMFCTGVAPGGGASNIWTFILGGKPESIARYDLHINPRRLWFHAPLAVLTRPVPLGIGLAIQKWTPRLSAFMVRILKGFSTTLLLFIIVFAIVTNLYIFELFTWEIVVAGMGVPWLGYAAGYLLGRVCRQPHPDALAISIETGIQNTGIAIFLLRYALPQPEADLTTVVPVAVAIMTPIPMTAIYIYQKIKGCYDKRRQDKKILDESNSVIPGNPEPGVIATIDVK